MWNLPLDKNSNISLLDNSGPLIGVFKSQQCTLYIVQSIKKGSRDVFLQWAEHSIYDREQVVVSSTVSDISLDVYYRENGQ